MAQLTLPNFPANGKRRSNELAFRHVVKQCASCGSPIALRNTRDLERKRFCSAVCKAKAQQGVSIRHHMISEPRICEECGADYIACVNKQRYCSTRCNARVLERKYIPRNSTL